MKKSTYLMSACLVGAGLTFLGTAGRGAPRLPVTGGDEKYPQWKVSVQKPATQSDERANAQVKIEFTQREATLRKGRERTFSLRIDFERLEKDRATYLDDWKQNPGRSSVRYVRLERQDWPPPPLDGNADPFKEGNFVPLPLFGDPCRKENQDLYERSLVITDIHVVNDERAQGLGPWSFGYLMTQLAQQQNRDLEPAAFVRDWLNLWNSEKKVNGDQLHARKVDRFIKTWEDLGAGEGQPLDLKQAPFRLLAIVNRLDLRRNRALKGLALNAGRDGSGEAGEVRFVFCAVDATQPNRPPLPFTVIFEYAVNPPQFEGVRAWAQKWFDLSGQQPGSPAFNQDLEKLTNLVTAPDPDPQAPFPSMLAQLRTNEAAMGSTWEMRQFHIDRDTGLLKPMPLPDTPSGILNKTATISDYLTHHRDWLLAEQHHLPLKFPLGGSISTGQATRFWEGDGDMRPESRVRRFFSLSTCNGCHAGEAFPPPLVDPFELNLFDDNPPSLFTHIRPRARDKVAKLSRFLTGEGNGRAYQLTDPGSSDKVLHYELERRANDLSSLVRYGLVYELQRMHVPAAH
jgi:hypothetical protein